MAASSTARTPPPRCASSKRRRRHAARRRSRMMRKVRVAVSVRRPVAAPVRRSASLARIFVQGRDPWRVRRWRGKPGWIALTQGGNVNALESRMTSEGRLRPGNGNDRQAAVAFARLRNGLCWRPDVRARSRSFRGRRAPCPKSQPRWGISADPDFSRPCMERPRPSASAARPDPRFPAQPARPCTPAWINMSQRYATPCC